MHAAAAQRIGLAERDPAADVEGHDTVAKLMILAALVFGRQLRRDQVACQGITDTGRRARDAAAAGGRLRHVATLAFAEPGGGGTVTARVRPEALPADDPLARVDGAANALVFEASPVGQSKLGRRAVKGSGAVCVVGAWSKNDASSPSSTPPPRTTACGSC